MKEFLKKVVTTAENIGIVLSVISALGAALVTFTESVKPLTEKAKDHEQTEKK